MAIATKNSNNSLHSLELAGYGGAPADWSNCFYPDDLPPEWQMAYYANEFSTVLLPASFWQGKTDFQRLAESWLLETRDSFRFHAEITTSLLRSPEGMLACRQVMEVLGARLAGILLHEEALPELPASLAQYTCHVLQAGHWLAEAHTASAQQLGIWQAHQPLSPLALRERFTHLLQQAGGQDVLLFLDMPWASVEQVRLMQQLYGIAS